MQKKNDLLIKNVSILNAMLPGAALTADINKNKTRQIMAMSLGAYWTGVEMLKGYYYALFAVFAAKINRDRDGAVKLIEIMNEEFAQGKMNYTGAHALFVKHVNSKDVVKITSRHAYLNCVMASMLEGARSDGVLASADFLWLKTVDRKLWYVLNSVGRQTPFAEVSGIFSHWKCENKLGFKSIYPLVDEGVKALEMAVKEVKLTIEELQEIE